MKITKRQLRRIIKEEKAKILKESISDMSRVANDVGLAASQIADVFADQMSLSMKKTLMPLHVLIQMAPA